MPHPALLVVSTEQTFPSTDPPAVVTQIANPRVGPMALRQRKRLPVYNFADNSSTISAISNALAFILEMTQNIAATSGAVLDETQSLVATTSDAVDEVQNVAASGTDPLEAQQGIASTDAMTLEEPQGIAATGVEQLDERQNIVQTGATGVDEVQPVSQKSQFAVGSDLSAIVGSFAMSASTGNQAITGVGFTPKIVLIWSNEYTATPGHNAGSSSNTHMPMCFGMTDGASACCWTDSDDFSSGNPGYDNTNFIIHRTGGGTITLASTIVSLDSDGFTINNSTASSGIIVNYMALGGAALTNVFLKKFTGPSATGNLPVTGVGFQPDSLLLLGGTAPGSSSFSSIGLAAGADQSAAATAYDGAINRYQRTDKVYIPVGDTLHTKVEEATLASFDSDGFTLNYTTEAVASTAMAALCLKGALVKVGNFVQETSNGTHGYTGVGFTPKALLLLSTLKAASTTVDTTRLGMMVGGTDGTNRSVVATLDNNFGVSLLDQTKCYQVYNDDSTPTLAAAADITSFDSDGFTLNYTATDATAREVLYFAFGGTGAGMPYESLLGTGTTAVSQTAQLFIEALQAIAATGVFPLEALKGVLQTSGDVIEDPQGVVQTDAQVIEDPQGIATTDVAVLDEAGGVAQTGSSGVDEVQPISSTGSEVVEASQGVTQSGTEVIEDPQGVATTDTEVIDEAQGIAATTSDPVDETQGIVGGSRLTLHFDGLTQSSTVADAAANKVATNNAFTVAFWVKLDSFNNNILPRFWEKGSNYMALMGDSANGKYRKIAIEVQNNSGTGNVNGGASEFWGSTQLNVGQWYHVAGTFDGAGAGTANIYLNGVAETIAPIFPWSDVLKDTTQAFWHARRNADNLRNLNGFLRKMVMYQSALTQAQCQQIYRAASVSDLPAGYSTAWMMGEGTGTSLADSAGGTSMTTSGTWQLDGTEMFIDEAQGVATVALVPYTALQGIAQTSGDPYESLGNTPVSQVAAMVLEALQGILQTDVMTLDETQNIVGTGSEIIDEAGGVASTTVAPLDEPGGVAATGIMPLSKLQGIVQLALTVLDATQNLATTASDPLESAQGVNTTVSDPIEVTQGVTATGSGPYESLGNTAVSQTSAFIIEALGAVTATGQLVLEALQSLASTGQLTLDETQGIVITGSPSPVEAPGGVSVTDVQIMDATGAILSPRDLPLDVTGAILTIGLAPVETTAGVAPTTVSVPLEAAQGILKALTHQLEEPGALVVLVPLPIDSISAIPVRILVFVGNADALRYAGTVTLVEQLLKPGAVTPGEALLHPGNVAPVETPLHPGQVTESDATAHPGNAAATDDVH